MHNADVFNDYDKYVVRTQTPQKCGKMVAVCRDVSTLQLHKKCQNSLGNVSLFQSMQTTCIGVDKKGPLYEHIT